MNYFSNYRERDWVKVFAKVLKGTTKIFSFKQYMQWLLHI